MATVYIHPRLAAGHAAVIDRLGQALHALRGAGVESLSRAGAALRRLPGDALTGSAHEMAVEIDQVIAELTALAGPGIPTIDMILRLERRLSALDTRLATARAQAGRA